MRGARTVALAFLAHLVLTTGVSPARAGEEVVEARADYDAAAAAYDRGDYATAAVRFARADERIPNPRALRLAMAAALLVSDAGLAMNLVERGEERARSGAPDPAVTELARKLRARFETAAGRIRASCPPDIPCRPSVDGEAFEAGRVRWATPGKHVITFETGGGPVTREIVVRAGQTVEVPLAPPDGAAGVSTPSAVSPAAGAPAVSRAEAAREETTTAQASTGLAPVFFWSALAATGVAVGAATVLTVVVVNRHDDFVDRPSLATSEAGDAAQTRARVAWAISGAFALTTVVLGWKTDFGGGRDRRASARSSPSCTLGVGPLAATLAGTF